MNNFSNETERELKQHILPFWMNLIDEEFGGFYGKVDSHHRITKDYPKGSIVNSRILWTFSASFNRYHDKAYLTRSP